METYEREKIDKILELIKELNIKHNDKDFVIREVLNNELRANLTINGLFVSDEFISNYIKYVID
ncbi:MAG: hypothetical protein ACK5OW_01450 [bacterium]|jgi:hypothetical protein